MCALSNKTVDLNGFLKHYNCNNSEDLSANKMIRALSGIALEMNKLHATTSLSQNVDDGEELSEKLSKCKSNLRLKRKQIKLLKGNLRKASIIAKIIMSAKENETISLHNQINGARSECADLYLKDSENTKTLQILTSGNQALQDKIEHLENFIELGYRELQKIRNAPIEKIPTAIMLKEIMLSCGQYYADYTNEQTMRMQLEQRNRFLNNKINIIVNNLEAVAEELKNQRQLNIRLRNENTFLKNNKAKKIGKSCEDIAQYEVFLAEENKIKMLTAVSSGSDHHTFDLTSHLSLVKNLLSDQDSMLQDLKKLSAELNVTP